MIPLVQRDINSSSSYSIKNRIEDRVKGWMKLILYDTNSRNLLLFLLLNLSFAFVELFYGIWTNSLGLISDSFHMFFDCTALLTGLVASVITKWKPDDKFLYGYGRAEVIAGFVNGLFLIFIAFFICSEAVERLIEPPEVKHERLFVVSVLGLLVNLVGVFVFHHGGSPGHCHSHGHSHGHSHNHNSFSSHNVSDNGHHHHHHHRENENSTMGNSQLMKGVYLHILADFCGSVSVVISSILMYAYGWMRADPICSMFVSSLICWSVYDLIKNSLQILMQRQPKELDDVLPRCYQRVMQLAGVYSIQEPHFWTLHSGVFVGDLKLEVSEAVDPRYVISHTNMIFDAVGVKKLNVQLDYASM